MASFIPKEGKILELGSGVGRVTQYIPDHNTDRFIGIEIDPELSTFLKSRFPDTKIVTGDVKNLDSIIPSNWIGHVNCIISEVPLMYMPLSERECLINSALNILSDKGFILHATYSIFSPIHQIKTIQQECVGMYFLHLPPCFLWKYTKK
jgi:phospholipid N-methyltransferase